MWWVSKYRAKMPRSVIHGRAYRFMHVDDPNPAKICPQLRVVGTNPESLGTETVHLKTWSAQSYGLLRNQHLNLASPEYTYLACITTKVHHENNIPFLTFTKYSLLQSVGFTSCWPSNLRFPPSSSLSLVFLFVENGASWRQWENSWMPKALGTVPQSKTWIVKPSRLGVPYKAVRKLPRE